MTIKFTDTYALPGDKNKLPDGSIMCDARIARTGLQYYAPGEVQGTGLKDGGWLYRSPDQVFSPEALQSFDLATLTLNHPPGGVTPADYQQLSVGAVGSAHRDDAHPEWVSAKVHVVAQSAIRAIQDGTVELSCGYGGDVVEIEPTQINDDNGNPQTVRFTLENIRGNHVAIVRQARAGAGARLLLDSKLSDFIKKQGNEYVVLSHTGEVLGRHLTRKAALNQLQAIEVNKDAMDPTTEVTPCTDTAPSKWTTKVVSPEGEEEIMGEFDDRETAVSSFQSKSDNAHPEPTQPAMLVTEPVVANVPEIKAEVAKEALAAKGEVLQDAVSIQDTVTKLQAELTRVTSPMFLDALVKELDQVRIVARSHGVVNDAVSASDLRRLTVIKSLKLDLASFNDAQVKQIFDAVGTPVEKRVIVDSAPTAVVALPHDRVASAILAQHQAAKLS